MRFLITGGRTISLTGDAYVVKHRVTRVKSITQVLSTSFYAPIAQRKSSWFTPIRSEVQFLLGAQSTLF